MRLVALGLLSLGLLACSKKEAVDTPQPEPSVAPPQPSASAGTAVTANSAAPLERAEPLDVDADFVKVNGVSGQFFAVGDAVLVCGNSCEFPADPPPPLWIIEDGKAREAPELWPANAWTDFAAGMKKEGITSKVSYRGDYPKRLFAQGWGGGRTGEGNLPAVKFFVKYWVNAPESGELEHKSPLPPREYDEALLSLPTKRDPRTTFTYGGGGPEMAAEDNSLWIREGKTWVRKVAPWSSAALRRLADGDTLALGRGTHRISKQGAISELKVAGGSVEKIVSQGGVAYLVSSSALFQPTRPERFKLAPPERRAATRLTGLKPEAQLADAGVAAADASASAALEAPAEYTEGCTTPVVYVRNSEGFMPSLSSLAEVYRKHPEQTLAYPVYKVTFHSGQRYLVRAKDAAAAQSMLGWVKEHKDLSGELKCVDLDALFPDPGAQSERMERVYIHPWSGSLIPL